MTKFIDATREVAKEQRPKKETKFIKIISEDMVLKGTGIQPKDNDYVELIRRRDECYDFDLFVAYDEGRKGKNELWYLGEAGDEFELIIK